jgi:hypothetical protein
VKALIVIVTVLGVIGGGAWYLMNSQKPTLPAGAPQPATFAECAKYFPVEEGDIRRCTNGAGVVLTEDIGNGPLLRDSIQVTVPAPGDIISTPLYVKGNASAEWFDDDNSIRAEVLDANGIIVGEARLETKNLVQYGRTYQFEGIIKFNRPSYSATGILILNENANQTILRIPVTFK